MDLNFNLNFDIEKMSLKELQAFARNLMRIAAINLEVIKCLKTIIDLTENQHGE